MSKPAARLMDPTAHGGMVTGPGTPNVLIGKLPAAGLGDIHVCPMVTGMVPHVGGPVTLGSTGVMIGRKPAGRLGDLSTCIGPPSQVLMGCMTVLIGETGGGGAGAAASAVGVKSVAPGNVALFPMPKSPEGAGNHCNRFQFLDSSGRPLAGLPCKWKDSEGNENFAVSDSDGRIQSAGLSKPGSFSVDVGLLKKASWSNSRPEADEKVKLKVETEAVKDGTDIMCLVFAASGGGPEKIVKSFEGHIYGNRFQAEWEGERENGDRKEAEKNTKAVRYRILAYCGYGMAVSENMEYR